MFVVHSVGCGSVVSACVASNGVVHSTSRSSVRILVIYSFISICCLEEEEEPYLSK